MKRRTFITLLAAGPVAACARPAHATIRGLTMGTSYAVELATPIGDAARRALTGLIEVELAAIDRTMSTYDPSVRALLIQQATRPPLGACVTGPARGAR